MIIACSRLSLSIENENNYNDADLAWHAYQKSGCTRTVRPTCEHSGTGEGVFGESTPRKKSGSRSSTSRKSKSRGRLRLLVKQSCRHHVSYGDARSAVNGGNSAKTGGQRTRTMEIPVTQARTAAYQTKRTNSTGAWRRGKIATTCTKIRTTNNTSLLLNAKEKMNRKQIEDSDHVVFESIFLRLQCNVPSR